MTCVDCGGGGRELGVARNGANLCRCERCRLVFRRDWQAAFEHDLYDYYAEREAWSESDLYPILNHRRVLETLKMLGTRVAGRRMLDVGCGIGSCVRAGKVSGWDATGIDLSAAAVEIARAHGLACSVTDFFDRSLNDDHYDLIVMSELIEHVPQPSDFLARARELLAREGILYLTTPNWNSLGRRVLASDWRVIDPQHLSYFTPSTMKAKAKASGLTVQSISTSNLSPATVRKILRRPATGTSTERADQQQWRKSIEASPTRRTLKRAANATLNLAQAGENMKVLLRRD